MDTGQEKSADAKGREALWAFIMVFVMMWGLMIGTTLNTNSIQSLGIMGALGVVCALIIAIILARARWRRWSVFSFPYSRDIANFAWHLFLLTCILFVCYLAFGGIVQTLVLVFHAPVFSAGCAQISERDTALFVWDAMAKGAFELLAPYLHVPPEACPPDRTSWTETVTEQSIRWFTALVLVWYAIGFAKAWYHRLHPDD